MAQRDDLPATSTRQLTPGTDIGGYIIERKLGVGGMAVVYGAVQPRIGKRVAIKVLSGTFDDPAAVERFEQEARLVNAIGHRNIVDVFQFGELPDGRSFFVMEWLDGETVGARLKRGPIPMHVTLAILEEICDALEAAHEHGVVHRDLKADNIFLVTTRRGRAVKLLDFGLAKLTQGDAAAANHNTGVGILVGTPSYMSPEQARARAVDARTDIYSLGCLAFQMLTGQLPFRADNPLDLLNLHVSEPPPSAAAVVADVPRALSETIKQMMAKAPEERPSLAQIRQVLTRARETGSATSSGRRRGMWAVFGLCALASGVLIVVAIAKLVAEDPSPATPRESSPATAPAPAMAAIGADAAVGSPPATTDGAPIEIEPQVARKPPANRVPPVTPPPQPPPAEATTNPTTANEDVQFPGVLVLVVDVASEIAIDGTVRATDSLGGRFELRPGKHTLRITAPRRQTVEREVEIQTSATTSMTISAGAAPAAGPPATTVDAGPVRDEPKTDGSGAPPPN